MKDRRSSTSLFFLITGLLGLILIGSCLTSTVSASDKMKPEEVVLKHLESIGAAESISSVTSRIIIGACKFSYRSIGVGQAEGNAVIASQGNKSLIGLAFPEAAYPFERLGFDGKTFTTGYIRPGVRTVLGDFLFNHNEVFKEGLIGGALTQAWALMNLAERNPKLEYEGTRKVNGKDAHVLSYLPRKGSDFQIKLYFDAATFQHVRSEYVQIISSQLGNTDKDSSRQKTTRYELVEEFSDFKKVSGLTLPHNYKLRLQIDNQAGNSQYEWEINLVQYAFNRQIPPDSFNVETYKDQ